MNYFDLHIGDYQRKTGHLSLAEHGAYSLMLQAFYLSERPLPTDAKALYRLLRAETTAERKAIDSVSTQFWHHTTQGLTNTRAEEVLDKYKQWVDKQKANGKRGGRPNKSDGLAEANPNGGTLTSHLSLPTSHTHSDSEAAPNGSRAGRVGGTFEKAGSGWKPPTEEEIRAGK